ncbi:HEAT repeat domain-containing protein [Nodularia sp. NIES-3585]|uniref:HEAT repeat domain-containing protein n=1 Tax=Nodularia sp. NIES-3585 TaxID=1973477 RepID=UPI00112FF32D|nr:hypothetical protein [Nodularia sp. NIES-3585]
MFSAWFVAPSGPGNYEAKETLQNLINDNDDYFVPPFWLNNLKFDDQIEVIRRHIFLPPHNQINADCDNEKVFNNEDIIVNWIDLINTSIDDGNPKQFEANDRLEKIVIGNPEAIEPILSIIQDSLIKKQNKDYFIILKLLALIPKLGIYSLKLISILIELVNNNNFDKTCNRIIQEHTIGVLGTVGTGNEVVFKLLVNLLHNDKDWGVRLSALGSLGAILKGEMFSLAVMHLKGYLQDSIFQNSDTRGIYVECYWVLWHCAQNMTYQDFYQARHAGEDSENLDSPSETFTPQNLQAAINSDRLLSQTIHLICIDTSKFIDPNHPASKIYTEIVKAGCPKCGDGTPKTMTELQTYWDLLETDKCVVLVFYQGMGSQSPQLSDRILNHLSKFNNTICVISDQTTNDILNSLRSLQS